MKSISQYFKLDWKTLAIYQLAIIFFIFASQQLGTLFSIDLILAMERYGYPKALEEYIVKQEDPPKIFYDFLFWKEVTGLIFELVAWGISLFQILKNKKAIINFIILPISTVLLVRLGYVDQSVITNIVFTPGFLIEKIGLIYVFIANGIILLSIGMYLFFGRWPQKLITDRNTKQTEPT